MHRASPYRRTFSGFWASLGLLALACGANDATPAEGEQKPPENTQPPGDVPEPPVDVPSDDTDWSEGLTVGPNGPIPYVVVDQFGYRTGARKVAVIRDPQVGYDADESFEPGGQYAVVNVDTGDTVLTGEAVPWNDGATDQVSGDVAYWFDFSELTTPGTYYVLDVERNRRSVHFVVSDNVYRSVLKHAVRTFFYQRAGHEKSAEHAGEEWADAASHLGPGQDGESRSWLAKDDAATARDLRGGWYDAGDYNKYTSWTASYVIQLLRAYDENPSAFTDDYGIPESGNGIADVLDEALWGLSWLERMQLEDGSVLCIQGLDAASPPSSTTGPSYYGPPTTNATLTTASAFAYAAKVFGAQSEAELQERTSDWIERAERAWQWAEANPAVTYFNNDESRQPGSGGLGAGQQEVDDARRAFSRVEAAVYLFEVTGDEGYREIVDAEYATVIPDWGPSQWHVIEQETLLYYAALPDATPSVVSAIRERFLDRVPSDPELYGAVTSARDPYRAYMKDYTWGSNASKAAMGRLLQLLELYGSDTALGDEAVLAAEGYIHYLHGVNPLGLVYLTNMQRAGAEHSAKTLYHSWFSDSSPTWSVTTDTTPGPAPGFLVGGPNPQYTLDGCCTDGSMCYGASSFALCSMDWSPPLDQPPAKSYLQFNAGWPANSWAVTENSNGYQTRYIVTLARYAK